MDAGTINLLSSREIDKEKHSLLFIFTLLKEKGRELGGDISVKGKVEKRSK